MNNLVEDYIEYEGSRWERKLGVTIEDSHWDKLIKNILDDTITNVALASDWVQAVKKGAGWSKYGRQMYSAKLDKLRSQTILEFYGNSVVD